MTLVALIIIDHGSRRAEANDMLPLVAQRVARHAGNRFVSVQPAHMELAEPTMDQAFDACVAAGATHVVVALYFLSPGRHSTQDIPQQAKAAAARHPGVTWAVADPLGDDDRIALVLLDRTLSKLA